MEILGIMAILLVTTVIQRVDETILIACLLILTFATAFDSKTSTIVVTAAGAVGGPVYREYLKARANDPTVHWLASFIYERGQKMKGREPTENQSPS